MNFILYTFISWVEKNVKILKYRIIYFWNPQIIVRHFQKNAAHVLFSTALMCDLRNMIFLWPSVQSGVNFTLSNGLVTAVVSPTGQLLNLYAGTNVDRDVFKQADGTQLYGNKLLLFDDQPLYWDAWDVMDYHLETETTINELVGNIYVVDLIGDIKSSH